MRKLILVRNVLAALATSTFVWGNVSTFDAYSQHTNVTQRYLRGTIQADVRRVQTHKTTGFLNKRGYDHNMKAIRKHAECATQPLGCKSVANW